MLTKKLSPETQTKLFQFAIMLNNDFKKLPAEVPSVITAVSGFTKYFPGLKLIHDKPVHFEREALYLALLKLAGLYYDSLEPIFLKASGQSIMEEVRVLSVGSGFDWPLELIVLDALSEDFGIPYQAAYCEKNSKARVITENQLRHLRPFDTQSKVLSLEGLTKDNLSIVAEDAFNGQPTTVVHCMHPEITPHVQTGTTMGAHK
jgi:hypothetical protein